MQRIWPLAVIFLLPIFAAADEKLKGIACRSVHFGYPATEGTAFYNQVTVKQSREGTYFCVCGFNAGYFGIQEKDKGRKVVIFSVWDPGSQNDPKKVKEEDRVKMLHKDDAVRVGRFGNEGTGGQSFLDYDWKVGETYRFLVTAKPDGERTAYAGHFFMPEKKEWKHLVTFSTLKKGKLLGGYYSFIEDFKRNKVSATLSREAWFGNGFARDKDGKWLPLVKARFTGDANPVLNINAKLDGDRFLLGTGGGIENKDLKLKETAQRPEPKAKEPDVPPIQ